LYINPFLASQNLTIRFQKSECSKISRIDLIDLQTKPIDNLSFDIRDTEGVYKIKSQKSQASQFYFLKVTLNDQHVYFRKILVQ